VYGFIHLYHATGRAPAYFVTDTVSTYGRDYGLSDGTELDTLHRQIRIAIGPGA
jgi:hypothetical protein